MFFAANTAKKSTKKGQNTSYGDNPYVEDQKSERELYIQNELINIQKEERRNKRLGDKNPGFAPKKFELWRTAEDGKKTRLAKGVLDYDLTQDGIIYTNGRCVFLIEGETEKLLFKDKRIDKVRLKTDFTQEKRLAPLNPFDN